MATLEAKKIIRAALESNDLEAVVGYASRNRQTMSFLVRLAYEKDTLVGWRAIIATGLVARALAGVDHDFLRITVRKLLWSLSDESGGIGWSAPELLGEIVSADPQQFADIIPLIAEIYDIEEQTFRPGILYALARIAGTCPELVVRFQAIIEKALTDPDPLVNVYALDLVSRVWPYNCKESIWDSVYRKRVINSIDKLKNCSKVAWIYAEQAFIDVQVGEYSRNVLVKLNVG